MSWAYDHFHFKCSDHERTVTFFKENFGAQELKRLQANGFPTVTLNIGGLCCNFSPKKPGEIVDSRTDPPRYGVYHMALNTNDLVTEVAKMKSRGVRFTQEITQLNPTTKIAFIEGPDGISIEILQKD